MITIKKGPHGYYTDEPKYTNDGFGDPIIDETFDRTSAVLTIGFNQPGCRLPLVGYTVMYVTDINGRECRVVCNKDNEIEKISVGDELITSLDLDENNGFWFLVSGIPKQTAVSA